MLDGTLIEREVADCLKQSDTRGNKDTLLQNQLSGGVSFINMPGMKKGKLVVYNMSSDLSH